MKGKVLLLGLAVLVYVSTNAQVYSLKSSCLINDWIDVDTCSVEKGMLLVIHYDNYKIHAFCKELSKDMSEIDIQAVYQKTSYPVIGYRHVFNEKETEELITDIQFNYGDNEYRITNRLAKKEQRKNRKEKMLAKKE